MKKKFVAIMMVAAMAASMAACGSDGGSSDTQKGGSSTSTSDVANKDKPLAWFNRQPSNSSTGELDTTALNYNKDTFYVFSLLYRVTILNSYSVYTILYHI